MTKIEFEQLAQKFKYYEAGFIEDDEPIVQYHTIWNPETQEVILQINSDNEIEVDEHLFDTDQALAIYIEDEMIPEDVWALIEELEHDEEKAEECLDSV